MRRRHQLRAAGEGCDLRLARPLEMHHEVERIVNGRPAHQQAVIAQDHRVVRAEVAHEPCLLGQVERDAFVVVVADGVCEAHGVLRERQEPVTLRRDGESGRRVRVHDARDVVPRAVHGAVDHEARRIDAEAGRVVDDLAVERHLHERRRLDLGEEEAVGVDEEVPVLSRHACGNVRVDEVGQAEVRGEPIACREVDARGAFGRCHGCRTAWIMSIMKYSRDLRECWIVIVRNIVRWLVAVCAVLATAASFAQAAYPSRPIRLVVPYRRGAHRHPRARHRRAPRCRPRAARRHRQQAGRGDARRRGVRGEAAARRLHAADGDEHDARDQPRAVPAVADRSGEGFHARVGGGHRQLLPDREPVVPGEDGEGHDRRDQGQPPASTTTGSVGSGSPHHLFMEALKTQQGLTIQHVPYKGTPAALTDLLTDRLQVMFSDATIAVPNIEAGKVTALGHLGGATDHARVQRAADRRNRAGLRLAGVAGHRRAGRHAEGDRGAAVRRVAEDPGDA
jgi:hypothetical protein